MSTTTKNNIKTMSKTNLKTMSTDNLKKQCKKKSRIISILRVHKVCEVHKENKYHFMPCQIDFLEARLALQVGSELKSRENRELFNHFNDNHAESFYKVKNGSSFIMSKNLSNENKHTLCLQRIHILP